MRRPVFVVFLVAALAAAGCGKGPPPVAPPEPPVVTVEHPVERTLDTFLEFTGYLREVEKLRVMAQVTGYLKKITFAEGETVKEGAVLYEIDPEPYQAELLNARAAVAKANADVAANEALLRQAQSEFARADGLKATNAISADELEKRVSARDAADATLKGSRAAVDIAAAKLKKAEFDRKNCTIRTNVKGVGRVGRTFLTKGNLVVANTTVLCEVTSVDPIYAIWDVDEITSLYYRRQIFDTKELPDPRQYKLKCWIGAKDEVGFPHAGETNFVNPLIVRGTGTREVGGVFANPGPDYRLSPGDSVRVKLEAGAAKSMLTVPEIAVTSQQGQKFVYVVGKDKDGNPTAEMKPVIPGPVRTLNNGAKVQVIEPAPAGGAGLTTADLVVVNGLLRVRPGVVVNPKEQTPLGDK